MLQVIRSFEFTDWNGPITLMTEGPGDATDLDPVFLISAVENVGYLRRAPGEVYAFRGIDAKFVRRLLDAESLTVMETVRGRIALIYDADVGPLEYDRRASAAWKTLAVLWHKFTRYRAAARQTP